MRKMLSCIVILSGTAAMAQSLFQNQQQTSGSIGITPGQTARWNVIYPTAPAPILQILCSADLAIADDQGKILKSNTVSQLVGGKSASLELNADTDLVGATRTEIHAFSIAPAGCHFVATLELIDNATQKTVMVISGERTYPPDPGPAAVQTAAATAGPDRISRLERHRAPEFGCLDTTPRLSSSDT